MVGLREHRLNGILADEMVGAWGMVGWWRVGGGVRACSAAYRPARQAPGTGGRWRLPGHRQTTTPGQPPPPTHPPPHTHTHHHHHHHHHPPTCPLPPNARQGLGKTIQVIALLCHLAAAGERRASLIAVPASVLPNWQVGRVMVVVVVMV